MLCMCVEIVCSDQFVCGRLCALLCMCVEVVCFALCVWRLYVLPCMCVGENLCLALYVYERLYALICMCVGACMA